MSALAAYPSLADAQQAVHPTGLSTGVLTPEEERNGVVYRRTTMNNTMRPVIRFENAGKQLRDHLARFSEVAPAGDIHQTRDRKLVMPAVGNPPQVVGPFSGWWALLFLLSSFARYRPAEWRSALDLDRSELAVSLERILDRSEETLPHHVLGALDALI